MPTELLGVAASEEEEMEAAVGRRAAPVERAAAVGTTAGTEHLVAVDSALAGEVALEEVAVVAPEEW